MYNRNYRKPRQYQRKLTLSAATLRELRAEGYTSPDSLTPEEIAALRSALRNQGGSR